MILVIVSLCVLCRWLCRCLCSLLVVPPAKAVIMTWCGESLCLSIRCRHSVVTA